MNDFNATSFPLETTTAAEKIVVASSLSKVYKKKPALDAVSFFNVDVA